MTDAEFQALLGEAGKRIEGDIFWQPLNERHPARRFRANLRSAEFAPLFVAGWYNPGEGKLSYTIVYRNLLRIYGLDLGAVHQIPTGEIMRGPHKHYWTERHQDKMAYAPPDISAPFSRPLEVWRQFCAEARIEHRGVMHPPQSGRTPPA